MNFEIPDGLADLLRDFTVSVLREKPTDLYDFAVDYFKKARESKRPKAVPMYIIVDSDEDGGEPDPIELRRRCQTKSKFARRSSVAAERYNPEEDSEEDEKVVHPKSDAQRERLTEAVSGILIFKSLDPEQMQDVIDAMFMRSVNPGDEVIKQGDDGDNFYVIDDGTYDVLVDVNGEQKKVHQFQQKGSFGELALLYNMPRSATIKAISPGTLWAMDRSSFRHIVLKSAFKKRKLYEEFLESVPILESLDNYECMNLADALVTKTFYDNETIIKQGDDADGLYFVESGTIRVTIIKSNGVEEEVSKKSKGAYFGELALIENKPRSANVYAMGQVKVAFLERECFERLLGPCLEIMKRNTDTYKKYANMI